MWAVLQGNRKAPIWKDVNEWLGFRLVFPRKHLYNKYEYIDSCE